MSSRLPDEDGFPPSWGEAWRSNEPSPSEVRSAYLRFSSRRRAGSPVTFLQVGRWVLVGVFIGVGSVYAAAGVPQLLERATPVAPAPSAARPSTAPARKVPGATPEVAAPSAVETPAPARSEPARPTASAVARERWQRAARGMRGEDFQSAQAALEELARDGDDAQRESARLVQAQLLIAQGRQDLARPLLEQLRSSARAASVQQKAGKLLSQMEAAPPARRSFEPAPGANEP
jgi:hypothetical protein